MIERAVTLFRSRQTNCAQSVAQAWCEKTRRDCQEHEHLRGCGHGHSPGGMCGALYAAKLIAGPDRATQVETAFMQMSGGLTRCRDLRTHRAMACADCVGTAARALSEQIQCGETLTQHIRPTLDI
jgi:hypothetical protein